MINDALHCQVHRVVESTVLQHEARACTENHYVVSVHILRHVTCNFRHFCRSVLAFLMAKSTISVPHFRPFPL